MKVIRGIDAIDFRGKFPYPVLTIGNFDGVHIGHRAIFEMVESRARENNGTSMAFTFEPHPLKVVAPSTPLRLLTTSEEKERLIRACGIDVLILASFSKRFADQHPEEFIKDILVDRIGVREVFVGHDYSFGKGRKGTPELLKKLGEGYGFKVTVLDAVKIDGQIVSSSKIRSLLLKGDVEKAARFLGRPYSIEGIVVEGRKIGASVLGIPTANITTPNEIVPKEGVYAVTVSFDKDRYMGVANIGKNPTFGQEKMSYEVHILDFSGNLIGKRLRMNFIRRIRDEIRFDTPGQLSLQIKNGIMTARDVLS